MICFRYADPLEHCLQSQAFNISRGAYVDTAPLIRPKRLIF